MNMQFRKVTAIIQNDRLQAVEERLKELGVPGISITKVKGFGEYADFYEADWMCTHMRLEIFIGVHRAEEIATAIMDTAHTGVEGDGIVAVLPVESVYHIRTKQKCEYDACD